MEILKFEKDRVIAAKNEKVKCWYLIQQGAVIQKTEISEVRLEKNSIIGFLEQDIYLCDYIAAEDTVLAAFSGETPEDIKKLLAGQEKARYIFLRSAMVQRHQILCLYSELSGKLTQFRNLVGALYSDYKTLCGKYRIPEQSFPYIEQFKPLIMEHRAEKWEVSNSVSIIKSYLQDYIQLMSRDDGLTIGVIMEASAQMHRFTLGILEMESYLLYNKEILMGEAQTDLFQLYFDLAVEMYVKQFPIDPVKERIGQIPEMAEKLQIYNGRMIRRRMEEFENYDFAAEAQERASAENGEQPARREVDITKINCVNYILDYAGYKGEEIDEISGMIESYFALPDLYSTDSAVYGLRKKVAETFYEVYYRVFIRCVREEAVLPPVLKMFLNFGFMDYALIGEEHAKALLNLCAHLEICHSKHVFTIYEWLKRIYEGKSETSKNEFDKNYQTTLAELYKSGKITQEQMNRDAEDPGKRVRFEIQNMFQPINKLTYGKVTTFCPILCDDDLINSVDKMLITADKLESVLNEVRKVDYSIFYREVPFSDPAKGINNERVMKEVLPDIILMPNAGSKGMMWQETAGAKSDTPARFMLPIFTSMDLNDMMLEILGRYRWEMCRKVEGIYWNDFREKSLTAEYCAYLQFYKKNNELSAEAKEKIKNTLARSKNNYREVFVRDYVNLIKFECRGSYRLNRISRDILLRYCPFTKAIRNELRPNPFYQQSITKFEIEMQKKLQKYQSIDLKYDRAGGEYGKDIKETVLFYEM